MRSSIRYDAKLEKKRALIFLQLILISLKSYVMGDLFMRHLSIGGKA